jgi:hypothetical protein
MKYLVTRDGGHSWRSLRIPGWSLGQGGIPGQNADQVGASVCFAPGGAGWAVTSRAGGWSVLDSADGGRTWHVALPPGLLSDRRQPAVAIGGCSGHAVWVVLSQGDKYGDPTERDLLHTTNLGRTWLDVLRWTLASARNPPVPQVPSPPGGPRQVPGLGPYLTWLAAPAPNTLWVSLADDNMVHTGLGVTADGGLTWHFWAITRNQTQPGPRVAAGAPTTGMGSLTAVDARHAFMLTPDPTRKSRCWLYATADGGAAWSRIAMFRTGLPPPPG